MSLRHHGVEFCAVFIALSIGLLGSAHASAQGFEMPSLAGVVTSNPTKEVELQVDLQRIFRGQDVEHLLEDFDLRVTKLEFKHVGSGGGGLGVPKYGSFSEYYAKAESGYISRLARLGGFESESLPPCEIEDNIAPIVDQHGRPASKRREAACGLRIHKLTVKGPASSALDFTSSLDPSVASVQLVPSEYDMMRLLWHMHEDVRTQAMLEQVRARFPEFNHNDFPE